MCMWAHLTMGRKRPKQCIGGIQSLTRPTHLLHSALLHCLPCCCAALHSAPLHSAPLCCSFVSEKVAIYEQDDMPQFDADSTHSAFVVLREPKRKPSLFTSWCNSLLKNILTLKFSSTFKDFWKIFHSIPIPALYLKRLKSYSLSKWKCILQKCWFFIGIAELNLYMFALNLMPFPNE